MSKDVIFNWWSWKLMQRSENQQVCFSSVTTKEVHLSECNCFADAHSKVWQTQHLIHMEWLPYLCVRYSNEEIR